MKESMISHLLDTSVYSQRLRPKPVASAVDRWRRLGDSSLAISSVCEAELRYGLARKKSDRLWREYRDFLENRLVLLPVDKPVADLFGEIKCQMEIRGAPRADFDLLIAATALSHQLVLATLNARHFDAIPGLRVEDWSL
jgi:predicted nucleic acid-binding protein